MRKILLAIALVSLFMGAAAAQNAPAPALLPNALNLLAGAEASPVVPDEAASQLELERTHQIVLMSAAVTIGVAAGLVAGSWINTWIDDTHSTSLLSNGWVALGDAAVGAALSFGVYELGRRVWHWW
jgi:hypothetical protein